MKKLYALTVAVVAALGLAQIATAGPEPLPSSKEMKEVAPAPPPECNWTGFYFGALVGYDWNDLTWTDVDTSIFPDPGADTGGPEKLVDQSADGVIAGGTIGYNYQFGRHFVIGAEGDFSWSNVGDTSSVHTESFTNRFRTDDDWLGTFGARLGFACNKFLIYAKGGGAVKHQQYSLAHTVLDEGPSNHVDHFTADQTWLCPMVGGGIEYMINCHWSVKVEYESLFWGSDDISGTNVEADSGPEPESYQVDLKNENSVRAGLNYKF